MDKLFGEGNREAVCVGTGEAPRLDWRELCLPILLHLQHLLNTLLGTPSKHFLGHFFGTLCLPILLHLQRLLNTIQNQLNLPNTNKTLFSSLCPLFLEPKRALYRLVVFLNRLKKCYPYQTQKKTGTIMQARIVFWSFT